MLENFSLDTVKSKFKNDSRFKYATIILGVLLLLIVGGLAYYQFIWKAKNDDSKNAYWKGLNYAEKDSTNLAITELTKVKKKYDGYIGGEIAQFVLARQFMAKGEFKKAIKELEGVKLDDSFLTAMRLGLMADCQSELKDYKKATETYLEASETNVNDYTTPMYLFKAGIHSEKLNDFKKATELYSKIRDEYPAYAGQKTIDKYIARASGKVVK
jgi:predicted negative regulator of RcsB-dependent stress response